MSTEALFWAMKQENVPPGPKFTLIMIADWYNKQYDYAWPKHSELAEKTGYGVSTIKRHIEWLIDHGLVKKEKQFWQGSQRANRYYLPINVMAFQVAQNELLGGADLTYPVAQNELPSNTITNTPTDTPNCADAQSEENMKLEDIQAGKKSKAEILAEAKRDHTGKLTPKGCAYLWRHSRASAADDNGFGIELTTKAMNQLKQVEKRMGDIFPEVIWNVMSDWVGFTQHAESTSTAFDSPANPSIDYFVKFAEAAADFIVEEDLGEGFQPKVKSIAKPLTNEPLTKDNGHKAMSKEEFKALSKELGK